MSTGEGRPRPPRPVAEGVEETSFQSLHDQFEDLIAEVWRQEAWQRLEDRIDLAVRRLRIPPGADAR